MKANMANDNLFKSKSPGGAHHLLEKLVGEREGKTKTWFESGKPADESAWKGKFRSILDRRFVIHEYEGMIKGKPLQGTVIYGYNLLRNQF